MMKNVLLCGCGNIGFRHLQALSAMQTASHITIIEPLVTAHPRIADHIVASTAEGVRTYTLLSALPENNDPYDLAIIATSANIRRAVFEDIVEHHDVAVVLFEKVLFQKLADLDAVGQMLDQKGIAGFVNCGRRGFASYRNLVAGLDQTVPVDMVARGAAYGLASNAVHLLDLAEYLNHSALVNLDFSNLRQGSVPSKRDGFVEIFGTITGRLENGATVSITCEDTKSIALCIDIKAGDLQIEIDEIAGTQTVAGQQSTFAIQYVSGMPYLYDDALTTGQPGLTPYAASARQHRLYLQALQAHLGLPAGDDTACPIS